MFDELGIADVIDQAVQQHPEMRDLTVGEGVKAMVLRRRYNSDEAPEGQVMYFTRGIAGIIGLTSTKSCWSWSWSIKRAFLS
jgi:hypothetical protein